MSLEIGVRGSDTRLSLAGSHTAAVETPNLERYWLK